MQQSAVKSCNTSVVSLETSRQYSELFLHRSPMQQNRKENVIISITPLVKLLNTGLRSLVKRLNHMGPQAWQRSEREEEKKGPGLYEGVRGGREGGADGVERHQEVITIGLTETGTGVTLSHVVAPFHSTGRERRERVGVRTVARAWWWDRVRGRTTLTTPLPETSHENPTREQEQTNTDSVHRHPKWESTNLH